MKRRSDSDHSGSVNPLAAATVGTGVVALVTMALCPLLAPFSFFAFVPFYRLAQADGDREADAQAAKQADRLAETWKRSRRLGERGITVSASVRKGEGGLDKTVTRTYHYELDDDEM